MIVKIVKGVSVPADIDDVRVLAVLPRILCQPVAIPFDQGGQIVGGVGGGVSHLTQAAH